jgi:hypothetical protein
MMLQAPTSLSSPSDFPSLRQTKHSCSPCLQFRQSHVEKSFSIACSQHWMIRYLDERHSVHNLPSLNDGLTIVNRSTPKKRTPIIQITNLKLLFRVTKSPTGLSLLFLLLRETCMEWTQAWAITAGKTHDNLEHTDILRLTSIPY